VSDVIRKHADPARRVDPQRRVDPETANPAESEEFQNRQGPVGHVVHELKPQPPAPQSVPGLHQPQPILEQPPQPKHPDAIARDEALKRGQTPPPSVLAPEAPAVEPPQQEKK